MFVSPYCPYPNPRSCQHLLWNKPRNLQGLLSCQTFYRYIFHVSLRSENLNRQRAPKSFVMSESFNEQLLDILPDRHRHPQQHQQEWEPVLKKALGSHLDQMAESIRGFASARPNLLEFMSTYEKYETAERIVREYVAEKVDNAPLHLLSEESSRDPHEQQSGSPVNVEPHFELDDDMDRIDRRSVTMAAEPIASSSIQHTAICALDMAPPPRPVAPMAPMTPITPSRHTGPQAVAGPSNQSESHATDIITLRPAGKRHFDNLESEEQQQRTLPSPPKRSKPSPVSLVTPFSVIVTRSLDWFEVVSDEYIFRDGRCGSGWYAIRCNVGKMPHINKPTRFTQHPFYSNLALGHFNQKEKCHSGPTKEKYTEEKILQNFAFRGEYFQ